jgi:hypothetical protein
MTTTPENQAESEAFGPQFATELPRLLQPLLNLKHPGSMT